jgi:hypothetical protein
MVYKSLKDRFEVNLCTDLVNENCLQLTCDYLRFSLCSADVKIILDSELYTGRFLNGDIKRMIAYFQMNPNHERRTHALLGQSILKDVASFKYSTIEFYVHPNFHVLSSWKQIKEDTVHITNALNVPDDFQEWVDDDNLCYDDGEDFENEFDVE